MPTKVEIEEFRSDVTVGRKGIIPDEALNCALDYFIDIGQVDQSHVKNCLSLANRIAASTEGKLMAAAMTSSILIESEGIARRVEADIENLRLQLFGSKRRPFKAIEKAAEWIESTTWRKLKATDRKLALLRKKINAILEKCAEIDGRDFQITPVDNILPYLKTRTDEHVSHHPAPRKSKQAILAQRTKELAAETGFSQLAVVNFVLLGTRPLLPPTQVTTHQQGGIASRAWATVHFNSPDVTMRQFRALYNSLRRDLSVVRAKPFNDSDEKFLALVSELGGAPSGRTGTKGFWERFVDVWNKTHPGQYAKSEWRGPYRRFRRLEARLKKRRTLTIETEDVVEVPK